MKRKSKQDVTDQKAPASCNLHPTTQPSHSSAAQGAFTGKERGHTASATLRPCERPVQNLSPFDFSPTSNLFRLPLLVLLILSLSIASSIFIPPHCPRHWRALRPREASPPQPARRGRGRRALVGARRQRGLAAEVQDVLRRMGRQDDASSHGDAGDGEVDRKTRAGDVERN